MKLPVKFLLIAALFLAVAFAPAQDAGYQGSRLVKTGSGVYDAVDYLSVLSGETTLLSHTPASAREILEALDSLRGSASFPGDAALEASIRSALSPEKPLIAVGSGPSLASFSVVPSARLSLASPLSTANLLAADLLRISNETEPAINVPIALAFGDWVSCRSEFTAGKGYWASTQSGSWTNAPLTASEADMNVPTDAWVSVGNRSFTLAVGRGPLSMGRALSGSMVLSDSFDRPDWASLSFHSPAFRLYLLPVELAPNRYTYFHGLSLRPFRNLSIDLSEAASVNAPLDLRYLNPAMIYHNYAGWRDRAAYGTVNTSPVGTQFGASVEWVPIPGVKVYGQYAMNQFQTTYELSEYSSTASYIPNSLGGLLGAEWILPDGTGFWVVSAEGSYANPWLYVLENGAISYVWARRELVAPNGHTSEWIYGWTGNPYGPDTVSGVLDVRYDIPLSRRLGLSYRIVVQGSNGTAFLDNLREKTGTEWYPDTLSQATIRTPSGKTAVQHALRLSGAATLSERLEAEADLSYYKILGGADLGNLRGSLALNVRFR